MSEIASADGKMGIDVDWRPAPNVEAKELYIFDGAGNILDGPRPAEYYPIDYSPLFGFDFFKSSFLQSFYFCPEDFRNCKPPVKKISGKYVNLVYRDENGDVNEREAKRVFDKTLGALGFMLDSEDYSLQINVIIGDTAQTRSRAENASGVAQQFYLAELPGKPGVWKFDGKVTVLGGGNCFLDTQNFQGKSEVMIFVDKKDARSCLPGHMMMSDTVNEMYDGFSSALSVSAFESARYTYYTLYDRFIASLIYHPEFRLGMSSEDVAAFLDEHGLVLWNENFESYRQFFD